MKNNDQPVSSGDIIKGVEILSVDGYKEGVAKIDDFVIFVQENVNKGDTCKIKIDKVYRTYATANKL